MKRDKTALLIVDELAVIRRGLRDILSSDPGIAVVGEADNMQEAVALAEKMRWAVVITDIVTPYDSIYRAVNTLRTQFMVRSIAFTNTDDWKVVKSFIGSGGSGYLCKRASEAEIIKAVKSVDAGTTYISPLLRRLPKLDIPKDNNVLSNREYEITALIALGYTGSEIADRLCISPKTVETHRARISNKLRLQSRAQLVQYALKNGLIKP